MWASAEFERGPGWLRPLGLGLASTRLVLSWVLSGGIMAGGFFVAALTLSDRVSSSFLTSVVLVLFIAGSAAGSVHGTLLSYLGRPADLSRKDWARAMGRVGVWLLPSVAAGGLVAFWIGLTAAALAIGRPSILAGVVVGWMVGTATCMWGALEGWRAILRAMQRWPELRFGTALILITFAVLCTAFLATRPTVWFTDLRVQGVSAVVLALGASLWIATPVVIALLRMAGNWRTRRA
jgi:hypothetical protein